jgi:uncharacterized repeat protein (TIGR01451 family)
MSPSFLRPIRVALSILALTAAAQAQPLLKGAIQVDAGSTKPTGQTFGYRLTYNCSSTSGPCMNAQVVDLLPAEVQYVSTVPASPTGDVAAINVTPNFGGSGRTRVQFVMVTPLPAGNSGDLLVNVRFPNGSTPDGTVATNTADGINLGTNPGTFTTPPVAVAAVATVQVTLQKTLTTSPANLDLPESYRLRITNSNVSGALNLTAIGPVADTLPPGTVFNGATPAADCQPGCVGTTPATLTWTSPCTVPLAPNNNCDILVNVVFPSATFPSGTNVTNSFTADGTPLGEPAQNLGVGEVTHPVTTFVPNASAAFSKNMAGGTPNPPTLNQSFAYDIAVSNNGNVPLDNLVVIDTLPVELQVTSVTSGSYSGLADFAVGEGVRVSYEKNTALGVFTLWGSSPNVATNTTLTAPPPGLGAGEYLTRIRWEMGQAQAAMGPVTRPLVAGQIVNPDNAGGPVAIGDTIQNCADFSAVHTAGPTNVNRNACRSFVLSGPFAQLNPAKDNLSGGGPFNPGQAVSWRLRVRSAAQSSSPLPLESIEATDLLPVDLISSIWTFDDQGTGLPAPQSFEQIPNFAGSGRTLLRWRWNAGSGDLGVNQQVWLNVTTTIRNGAPNGALANEFTLDHDAPGLGFRCSGSSHPDTLDLDGDSDTAESLCAATGTITVAGIAQLVSAKLVDAACDGSPTASSAGTLEGGALDYSLRVQNVGTVAMENFVLIDILPFVGDTGVRDTTPRGSLWTPLLAAPIVPPPGTTLYYSTSGNPCRGEVGGPTTACDPPDWSTAPPTPISATRSFKVEFGSRVVGAFDLVEFDFSMSTPAGIPAGDSAFNSFAYQADRSDGFGSLAAEPQKSGVALGSCVAAALGDFVWVDLDHDGTQNDGPSGLNDVFVRLLLPGVDGLAGTADDVPLASTVTANGPGGAAGWYAFPGLAPGSYFVCIAPPPTYILTTANSGGDTSDSDGDPATACAPVTVLDPGEQDPDNDFGLIATQLAALGDYVWFDRDGDGRQNEPVTDGANGVTARLHLDDGDGTAETGGADPVVATTATADDIFGRPGYYRFDGLAPGLPYFVEFVLPASATGWTADDVGPGDALDSDADPATGAGPLVNLAPGEYDPTIDAGLVAPAGTLALGDQVWNENDDDGIFEPENGEPGVNGVRLDLYRDTNGDGEPTLDEYSGTTETALDSGFPGRYRFDRLAAGDYIVVVSPSAFGGGGALAGRTTATGNDPAPDPDDDTNGDDNGTDFGALVASHAVTLTDNGEPTSEDGDNDTNLTVDFGFVSSIVPPAPPPAFDYGDAPDVGAGTATDDYQTVALDAGAVHPLGGANAPFLGACVDADSGLVAGVAANGDDIALSALVFGSCSGDDDEDGVTFASPFVPGAEASFSIVAGGGAPCLLDAWVDWNRNGLFGDAPGEQIAASEAIPVGSPTVLVASVPESAIPGTTYARFRCSSAGGLPPAGAAADGEVEDYSLGVVGFDFGDAPDSYGTQGVGSAWHQVDPNDSLRLGSCVDTEPDGQPSGGADGDDTGAGTSRVGSCFDDEDGVAFASVATACQSAAVTVTASAAGALDAWIDFNADGDFGDTGEQVFASQALVAGANPLVYTVPCAAVEGLTYARLRLSAGGGTGPTGGAPDGEVEDLPITLGVVDFGDAPATYGTTIAGNGPNHATAAGFSLGATVDNESDGQPSVGATGDGADEDGVTLPAAFVACTAANLSIALTNTAAIATPRLDAWIDFDGDGTFGDPRDRITTALALVAGANVVPVNVPCDAPTSATYARFRLSSAGTPTPLGPAGDGEVEDWAVTVLGLDFGDAPDPTYPTLLASNGARHIVLLAGNPTLGATVDTEGDGQPNATLSGDDNSGGDDEDGVVFPAAFIPGTNGTLEVSAGATGGAVSCWIDWSRDGDWGDAGEQVVTNLALAPAATLLPSFAVPVGSPQGSAATRCRISTTPGLSFNGGAMDGEVEDHPAPVGVEQPAIGLSKAVISSERDATDRALFHVLYEIRVENLGNVTLTDVQIVDDLALTFADAGAWSVESLASVDLTVNPAYDGATDTDLLAAGNTLAVGASGTLTLQVLVDPAGNPGPYQNLATATGTSPGGEVVTEVATVPVTVDVSVIEIPALGGWGLALLALLLGGAATFRLRRRDRRV